MRRKTLFFWFLFILTITYYGLTEVSLVEYEHKSFGIEHSFSQDPIQTQEIRGSDDLFTIASWNLKIFGEKKASDDELLASYVDVIVEHDIFIIQEIRNKDGLAFAKLCGLVAEYNYSCLNSSRAGSGNSKEQYGYFFADTVSLIDFVDYNPAFATEFERPPFVATFAYQNESISVATIHVRPDSATTEIKKMDMLFEGSNRTVLLGDLNADCSYYKPDNDFVKWISVIKSEADTTVSNSDCAYDRILLSPDMTQTFAGIYGITTENITLNQSDHYPIWVALG